MVSRKQYRANNAIIRRLAKKYGIQYSGVFSSYLPNARRTKLWFCDKIKASIFNKFADEAFQLISGIRSISYRGMDPKSVGKWYSKFRGNVKSIYVYYK